MDAGKTTFESRNCFMSFTLPPRVNFNLCKWRIILSISSIFKTFKSLSSHEIVIQPLWGNEYFKQQSCVCFKQWTKAGLYVKDIFDDNGCKLADELLLNRIGFFYPQTLTDLTIFKRYIMKRLGHENYSNAIYVNIKDKSILYSKIKFTVL